MDDDGYQEVDIPGEQADSGQEITKELLESNPDLLKACQDLLYTSLGPDQLAHPSTSYTIPQILRNSWKSILVQNRTQELIYVKVVNPNHAMYWKSVDIGIAQDGIHAGVQREAHDLEQDNQSVGIHPGQMDKLYVKHSNSHLVGAIHDLNDKQSLLFIPRKTRAKRHHVLGYIPSDIEDARRVNKKVKVDDFFSIHHCLVIFPSNPTDIARLSWRTRARKLIHYTILTHC